MDKAHQFYLAACLALGKTPVPVLEDRSDSDKVSSDAFERLTICIRAENLIGTEVWIPKYDGTERHYWPVWQPDSSGLGFSYSDCDFWDTITFVGARLEYRTRELADQGAVKFKPFYIDYLTIPIK